MLKHSSQISYKDLFYGEANMKIYFVKPLSVDSSLICYLVDSETV